MVKTYQSSISSLPPKFRQFCSPSFQHQKQHSKIILQAASVPIQEKTAFFETKIKKLYAFLSPAGDLT
jgi:hypothetical protein